MKLVLYNILCSMNFIHSANIVHRDVKPANILINQNCQVKICDFGLARSLPKKTKSNVRKLSVHVSSRWYRAPELICLEKQYDQAIDIWGVGCIAYELIKFKERAQSGSEPNTDEKLTLFPGKFCHPLTPKAEDTD